MSLEADVVASIRRRPDRALVALDVDGTLAPIVPRPQDAVLLPGVREVLAALAARVATLALVSGRAARDVVRLGGLDDVAGLQVLGHYGLESWRDGVLDSPPVEPGVAVARDRLPAVLAAAAEGVTVEDKDHSLVVHTRQTAAPQAALDALTPALTRLAAECALELVPGKFVAELRPPGIDKGEAVRRLVAARRPAVVVYAGDDVGDRPAFEAVRALRDAGSVAGLVVFSAGDEEPSEVRELADVTVAGPPGVLAWLSGLL